MKLRFLLANLFLLINSALLYAQDGWDDADGPPAPETEGKLATPIDMYDGILLVVAMVMIVAYFYARNRRVAN